MRHVVHFELCAYLEAGRKIPGVAGALWAHRWCGIVPTDPGHLLPGII